MTLGLKRTLTCGCLVIMCLTSGILLAQQVGECVSGKHTVDTTTTCKPTSEGWLVCWDLGCQETTPFDCQTWTGTGLGKYYKVNQYLRMGECASKSYGDKDCETCVPDDDGYTFRCSSYVKYLLKTYGGDCDIACSAGASYISWTKATHCKGPIVTP